VAGPEATRTWIDEGGLLLASRWIAAILGALTALLTGAAARRLLGSAAVGAAAAVIVGFSFLHGRDSHYGVPDVPMTFFLALTLWASCRALTTAAAGWLVLAAAAAGAATATKYNGALAFVLPLAALWLRRPDGGAEPPRRAGRDARLTVGLAAVTLLAFLALNPFAALDFEASWDGFHKQLTEMADTATWAQPRDPAPVLYLRASLGLLGWAHLLVVPVGLLLLLRSRPREALLLTLFPALLMAGMLSKVRFHWRFALPLSPFLAILAAVAWVEIARRVAGWLAARRGAARPDSSAAEPRIALGLGLLLALATLEPAARLLKSDSILNQDDTWIQAADWVAQHVPPGGNLFLEAGRARVRFPPQNPVWSPDEFLRLGRITATDAEGRTRRVVDEGGWLLTDSFLARAGEVGGSMFGQSTAGWPALLDGVRQRHALVAEFPPGPQGDPSRFEFDSRFGPLVDFWSQERPGYTIRIYRIEPGTWQAQ
jgi:hypothetical protein